LRVSSLSQPRGTTVPSRTTSTYLITNKGNAAIHEAQEDLIRRGSHDDTWTIYIRTTEAESNRLRDAAQAVCRPEGADIIDAFVSSEMAGPELAVVVRARDQRDALAIAQRSYGEIRDAAGLRGTVGVVAAVSQPLRPIVS